MANQFPPNVRENIVTDDQGGWHEEPDQTLQNVVDDEVTVARVRPQIL